MTSWTRLLVIPMSSSDQLLVDLSGGLPCCPKQHPIVPSGRGTTKSLAENLLFVARRECVLVQTDGFWDMWTSQYEIQLLRLR